MLVIYQGGIYFSLDSIVLRCVFFSYQTISHFLSVCRMCAALRFFNVELTILEILPCYYGNAALFFLCEACIALTSVR